MNTKTTLKLSWREKKSQSNIHSLLTIIDKDIV